MLAGEFQQKIESCLPATSLEADRGTLQYELLQSDGSLRQFCRVFSGGKPLCVVAAPRMPDIVGLAESRSACLIGRHLRAQKIPVPEIYGYDAASGLLFFEDCGNVRLHDFVQEKKRALPAPEMEAEIEKIYLQVIYRLCHMQVEGVKGFRASWCYDSAFYDRRVMLERESGYFYRAFWLGLFGGEVCPAVEEEFEDMALHVELGVDGLFLHRDFQSRNIMLTEDGVRFIDYQAGRYGPPGYDLASLLLDPYANLSYELQLRIMEKYVGALLAATDIDESRFLRQYFFLALQRNLQIVGAFSFLYSRRKKVFFRDYIRPSLLILAERLALPCFSQYTVLRWMVTRAVTELTL